MSSRSVAHVIVRLRSFTTRIVCNQHTFVEELRPRRRIYGRELLLYRVTEGLWTAAKKRRKGDYVGEKGWLDLLSFKFHEVKSEKLSFVSFRSADHDTSEEIEAIGSQLPVLG